MCRYSVDGKTYSFNCLFISMKSQQQSRIPLKMAVLNLVHELMHAFGETNMKHDNVSFLFQAPSTTRRRLRTPRALLMTRRRTAGI